MDELQKQAVRELAQLTEEAQQTFTSLQLPDVARTGTPACKHYMQLAKLRAWALALKADVDR